jgi:hypothetical protein
MHAPHFHSTRHFAAERAPTAAQQWARLEGKSETMAEELAEAAVHSPRASSQRFCPRCFTSAAIGAAITLLIERLVL